MAYLTGPNQTVTRITEVKEGYEDTTNNQGYSRFMTMKNVILVLVLLSFLAVLFYLYKNRKSS